jgi:spore coat protein H
MSLLRVTSNRWPSNGDGNLFKEVWPGKASDSWMLSQLQTNKSVGDISAFKAFSAAISAATPGQERSTLGSFSDLAYWARYMAVDDAIANYDGITTYYTTGAADMGGNHNFFFYEEAADHFTIVPWDLEATLSTSSSFGYVPPWQTTPADCGLTYRAWADGNLRVMAPGCDPVFKALAADLTAYHAEAKRLLDGPFAEATVQSTIDKYASFVRVEASADPHGPGAAAFEKAVGFLRADIPRLRSRLEFIQTGKTTVPLEITLGETMDFEANDNYGLTVGTMLMCNPRSTVAVELNKAEPIDGSQSLRFSFDFGNETTAWQQWALYHIPFADGLKDLNTLTGIRFNARTNQDRILRFDLISPNDTLNNDGVHFGWDLALTTAVQPFEVLFANARIPSWAKDPGDKLTDILATSASISYQPQCNGRGSSGQLPEGTTDNGWVDIDDIEFF